MAKGQPKKQLEPRVGDVVKVVEASSVSAVPIGFFGKVVNILDEDRVEVLLTWKCGVKQILYLSDNCLRIIRGGAASAILRKYEKEFKVC